MQVGLWSMRYSTMLPQCLHVQSSGWVMSLISLGLRCHQQMQQWGIAHAGTVTVVSEVGLSAGQLADERQSGTARLLVAPQILAVPRARSGRPQDGMAPGCSRHKCRRSTRSRGFRYQGVSNPYLLHESVAASFRAAGLGSLYAHTGAGGAGIRRFMFFRQKLPGHLHLRRFTRNVESGLRR